jgi:hypothetical protein
VTELFSPAAPSFSSAGATTFRNSTDLSAVWNAQTQLIFSFEGTVTAMHLKQDFTSIYVAEFFPQGAYNDTTNTVNRVPVPPAANGGAPAANTIPVPVLYGGTTRISKLSLTSLYNSKPLVPSDLSTVLLLNSTSYPTPTNATIPYISSLYNHPKTQDLFLGWSNQNAQSGFVSVHQSLSGASMGKLRAKIDTSVLRDVKAMEMDVDGKMLWLGGKDKGNDQWGALEVLEIEKLGLGTAAPSKGVKDVVGVAGLLLSVLLGLMVLA